MTRRRIILAAMVLLLTTFVIAVQRDTFVRRWCLPAPPPAMRPAGPLDQVIDEFPINGASSIEMVRELERRSGVRIRTSALLDRGGTRVAASYSIRHATVEQLVCRICYGWLLPADPLTVEADGTVVLGPYRPRRGAANVRVHLSTIEKYTVFEVGGITAHSDDSHYLNEDPVLRFGDRLIVLTTPRTHWLIDQILREKAEAQKVNR